MMHLQAPFPLPSDLLILPSPLKGDRQELIYALNRSRAMDGTVYSYVKKASVPKYKLTYDLILEKLKVRELIEFYKCYSASKIILMDYRKVNWTVNFANNPIEHFVTGLSTPCTQGEDTQGEHSTINLQFIGVRRN